MCVKKWRESRDLSKRTKQNNPVGEKKYKGENRGKGEACSIMSISKNGKTLCFSNKTC